MLLHNLLYLVLVQRKMKRKIKRKNRIPLMSFTAGERHFLKTWLETSLTLSLRTGKRFNDFSSAELAIRINSSSTNSAHWSDGSFSLSIDFFTNCSNAFSGMSRDGRDP
jgi:hypothetical protein